jgi:hypothetical protein
LITKLNLNYTVLKKQLPDKLCLLVSFSLLLEGEPGSEMLFSVPPISVRKWLMDTCSIKDVPCLWKYHHSNIYDKDKTSATENRTDQQIHYRSQLKHSLKMFLFNSAL